MDNFERLAELLKVLGNPLRLKIIDLLNRKGALSVTEIYVQLNTDQSLVSHNLDKLVNKDLLLRRRNSKKIFYRMNEENPLLPGIISLLSLE